MRSPSPPAFWPILLAGAAACSTSSEPGGSVDQMAPSVAYNDFALPVQIHGGPFRPAYRFDAVAGQTSVTSSGWMATLLPAASAGSGALRLANAAWRDEATLVAELPAGVPVGVYDLQVQDPRGVSATVPEAFVSLGADASAPVITMRAPSPGSIVVGGTRINGSLTADDGPGQITMLTWTLSGGGSTVPAHACALLADSHQAECSVAFDAPEASSVRDMLYLDAMAEDAAGITAARRFGFVLAGRPSVVGISPQMGPSQFSTLVTISGSNFVHPAGDSDAQSLILLDGQPLDPVDGTDPATITGLLPPHDPGNVTVAVRSGNVDSPAIEFTYVASPTVRAVSPARGPAEGGTLVAIVGDGLRPQTQILFADASGSHEATCPRYISPNRIEVLSPPGVGSATIVANDPVSGPGTLPDGFTYDPGDGGSSVDATCETGDGGP